MTKDNNTRNWEKVFEMESLSIKIEFYKLFLTNFNNEEQEDREKAEKFYNENKDKHINKRFEEYITAIEKACLEDKELNKFGATSVATHRYYKLSNRIKEVKNYFLLFQKYRQALDSLNKDNIFLDIILSNKSIVYKNDTKLLEIMGGFISSYFEVQAIKLIQECMLSRFDVSYKLKFPTKPFKDTIDLYSSFVESQGYKINYEKELEFPTSEIKNFIENEIDFLDNPQTQVNKVIDHYNVSIGIESIDER